MSGDGAVTVCIPAYQSAEFIDQTLRCARGQTYTSLRILVSIDLSTDDTEAVCRRHAAEDDRVEVVVQRERLGWAGNLNFLLEKVDTEFGFLYMHDDVIEPTYCERLVAALLDRPDAASAHCDVEFFGGLDVATPARSYEGTASDRLLTYLVAPERGSLLRSMKRTALAGHLRLPSASSAGIWVNEPFQMELVTAGPVVPVPETLYRQWGRRPGGLTEGWRSLAMQDIVDAYRANTRRVVEAIDGLQPSPAERDNLVLGLFVFVGLRLRQFELDYGSSTVTPLALVSPEFTRITVPASVRELPANLRTWCEDGYDKVLLKTGRRALQVRDRAQATAAYRSLLRRHPTRIRSWSRLGAAMVGYRP